MFASCLRESFLLVVIFSIVPLGATSLCGLICAMLQTATQIQEQSITYALKFAVISLIIFLLSSIIAREGIAFTQRLLASISLLGGM